MIRKNNKDSLKTNCYQGPELWITPKWGTDSRWCTAHSKKIDKKSRKKEKRQDCLIVSLQIDNLSGLALV